MAQLGSLLATARPSSCSTDTKLYGIELSTTIGYGLMGPTDTNACMPFGYKTGAGAYYSASSCPYGYTTACEPTPFLMVEDGTVTTQPAYTCCPTQQAFSCMTNPSIVWQSTLGCTFAPPTPWSTTITSVYLNGSTKVTPLLFTTATQDGYGAYAIQFLSFSSDTVAETTTASGPSAGSSSTESSSTESSSGGGGGGGGGGGLSSGAAAGIGIAVALAAIIAGLLIFLSWNRRKRASNDSRAKLETRKYTVADTFFSGPKTVAHGTVLEMGNQDPDQPEMSGQDARHLISRRYEVDGSNVAELSG